MRVSSVVLFLVVALEVTTSSLGFKYSPSWRSQSRRRGPPATGCNWPPKPVALPDPLPAELLSAFIDAEATANKILSQQNTPGAHIALIYNQSIIWTHGYGTANLSQPNDTPTGNTIFRIASISKVFAAMMLFQLSENGVISLDEEVAEVDPNFYLQNPFDDVGSGITFRHLATHTAGLPRETPCGDFFSCNSTTKQIFDKLHNINVIFPPDTMSIYSNLGFSVLGRVMEEAVGMTYEDYVMQNIVKPLLLNGTGFDITPQIKSRMAVGYDSNGQVDPYWDASTGWTSPAGQMFSTTNDLSKVMMLFFRPFSPSNANTQILDGESIREMLNPIYFLNPGRQDGFGIPWEIEYYGGYMTRTKRGDINGYASEILMIPELALGLVVLVNTIEEASPVAVPLAKFLIPVVEKVLRELQEPPVLPPNWKSYLGNFVAADYGSTLNITTNSNNSQLFLTSDFVSYTALPLEWLNDDTFRILPPVNDTDTCLLQEVGELYQLVQFQRSQDDIVAVSVPGLLYGITWQRSQKLSDE